MKVPVHSTTRAPARRAPSAPCLIPDDPRHQILVTVFVGLGPRGLHRGTLFRVEKPELDAGLVDREAHLAAQNINFPDKMAFPQSADGRIARHSPHLGGIVGHQSGAGPHSGRRQGRLEAGVAAAHHDDVIGAHAHVIYPRRIAGIRSPAAVR